MSSSMGRIYDDYNDYESICEKLGITPIGLRDNVSFYDEMKKIFKEHGVDNVYDMFKKLKNN